MEESWEKQLACAELCPRCNTPLGKKDKRLLSVYDHQPICMDCKSAEEKRPDYEDRPVIAFIISALLSARIDSASYSSLSLMF
jgi:hypothetical protein